MNETRRLLWLLPLWALNVWADLSERFAERQVRILRTGARWCERRSES